MILLILPFLFFGGIAGAGGSDVVELGRIGDQGEGKVLCALPVLRGKVHKQGQVTLAEALRLVCQDSGHPLHEGDLLVLFSDHGAFSGAEPMLVYREFATDQSDGRVKRGSNIVLPCGYCRLLNTDAVPKFCLGQTVMLSHCFNAIFQIITSWIEYITNNTTLQ